MKKFKAAVFDMDGTLLDTMHIWHNMIREYLVRNNIEIPPEIDGKLRAMGIDNAVKFILDNFDSDIEADKLHNELLAILEDSYNKKSVFKPGALELLKKLHDRNISTVILSATPEYMLHLALGKLDAEKYFTHGMLSCYDLKCSKLYPEAFYNAVERLQVSADEVVVFEDAWYAANTAKKAGFTLALISDPCELKIAEMREMADFYVEKSWDEFPVDLFF